MTDDRDYDEWLEQRRSIGPPCELVDQIMSLVSDRETTRRVSWLICVGLWVEKSRLARYAACAVALLIGSAPFLFLARVAQLIVF